MLRPTPARPVAAEQVVRRGGIAGEDAAVAGYHINSLDPTVWEQLTTAPTSEQGLVLAGGVRNDLRDMLADYEGGDDDDEEDADDTAPDPAKWPLDRRLLAEAIRRRLASPDWYADLTMGDADIWDNILYSLADRPGKKIGIGFRCENDGLLYWDAAGVAARHGAPMMAGPGFGNGGFRYSGRARGEFDLMYTIHPPAQVRRLLGQLERAAPHFEALPAVEYGDRDQFFRGLLEPVRRIAGAGRVMWVRTDT
jgi:hypothetical protein